MTKVRGEVETKGGDYKESILEYLIARLDGESRPVKDSVLFGTELDRYLTTPSDKRNEDIVRFENSFNNELEQLTMKYSEILSMNQRLHKELIKNVYNDFIKNYVGYLRTYELDSTKLYEVFSYAMFNAIKDTTTKYEDRLAELETLHPGYKDKFLDCFADFIQSYIKTTHNRNAESIYDRRTHEYISEKLTKLFETFLDTEREGLTQNEVETLRFELALKIEKGLRTNQPESKLDMLEAVSKRLSTLSPTYQRELQSFTEDILLDIMSKPVFNIDNQKLDAFISFYNALCEATYLNKIDPEIGEFKSSIFTKELNSYIRNNDHFAINRLVEKYPQEVDLDTRYLAICEGDDKTRAILNPVLPAVAVNYFLSQAYEDGKVEAIEYLHSKLADGNINTEEASKLVAKANASRMLTEAQKVKIQKFWYSPATTRDFFTTEATEMQKRNREAREAILKELFEDTVPISPTDELVAVDALSDSKDILHMDTERSSPATDESVTVSNLSDSEDILPDNTESEVRKAPILPANELVAVDALKDSIVSLRADAESEAPKIPSSPRGKLGELDKEDVKSRG